MAISFGVILDTLHAKSKLISLKINYDKQMALIAWSK